jgi:hypothetical protein
MEREQLYHAVKLRKEFKMVHTELRSACTGLSIRDCTKSPSHRHCERSEAIQNAVNHWLASGCALIMTLFAGSVLRCFSGLLHCVRNDGQRWFVIN